MIYATTSTLEDQVGRWWEAHGCPPGADLTEYAGGQGRETLREWCDWLRSEAKEWRDHADEAEALLDSFGPDEVSDDVGTRFDEADANAEDCRLMLKAAINRIAEEPTP
jgi:hypothetical protein